MAQPCMGLGMQWDQTELALVLGTALGALSSAGCEHKPHQHPGQPFPLPQAGVNLCLPQWDSVLSPQKSPTQELDQGGPSSAQQRSALIPDLRPGFWLQPAVARSSRPLQCVQNP